jgi:hypothetical protein
MKQLIYLVSIVLLNACVDQASDSFDYIIFNQTDKNVKVLGFDQNIDAPEDSQRADPIIIDPNSSFKVTRVNGIESDTGKRFYSVYGVDSVRVVFNNERVKVYGGTNGPPCYICSGDENHQHFITEQDYETATPCNGDCE